MLILLQFQCFDPELYIVACGNNSSWCKCFQTFALSSKEEDRAKAKKKKKEDPSAIKEREV